MLSGSTYPVSDRARSRVEEAASALNYVTNSAARALVTGRSEIVGAIVHDIADPFFSVVVRGLQDAAVAEGLVVLVGNDDRDADKLEGYLTMLLSQKPTGVVLIGGQLREPAATLPVALAVQRLCEQGVPVVAVGRYELDIPHVAVDDVAAPHGGRAPDELGHRQIAFLGGPLNSTTVQDRYSGYSAALMRVGEPLDERLVAPTPLSSRAARRRRRPGRRGAPFTPSSPRPTKSPSARCRRCASTVCTYRRRQRGGLRRRRHVGAQRPAAHHHPGARPRARPGRLAAAAADDATVGPRGLQQVPVELVRARLDGAAAADAPGRGDRRRPCGGRE